MESFDDNADGYIEGYEFTLGFFRMALEAQSADRQRRQSIAFEAEMERVAVAAAAAAAAMTARSCTGW